MSADTKPQLGPDGEIVGGWDKIIAQSSSTTKLLNRCIESEKEKETKMFTLMEKLVENNPEQKLPLYVVVNHGSNREVILTVPFVEKDETEAFNTFNYLVLSKRGFTLISFQDDYYNAKDLQNPNILLGEVGNLGMFHQSLKKQLPSTAFYNSEEISKRFKAKIIEINPSVAISRFEEIQDIIKGYYQSTISNNESVIYSANTLIDNEKPKPKSKKRFWQRG